MSQWKNFPRKGSWSNYKAMRVKWFLMKEKLREMKKENLGKKERSDFSWFGAFSRHFRNVFIQFSSCFCFDFETFLTWPVLLFSFIFYFIFCWSTWEFSFFKTRNFTLIKWLQCYVIYCTFLGFYLTTFRAVSCAAAATLTLLRLRSFRSAPASAACPLAPATASPFPASAAFPLLQPQPCSVPFWHASPQFCWRKTCESDGFKRGGSVTGGDKGEGEKGKVRLVG